MKVAEASSAAQAGQTYRDRSRWVGDSSKARTQLKTRQFRPPL